MKADGEHEEFERMWGRASPFYRAGDVRSCESFAELWEAVKFRRLEEFFPHRPQLSLEVGCGSGGVSLYFHDAHGYRVTLVDRSEAALAFARKNFEANSRGPKADVAFVRTDAKDLPFQDESFDLVMSFGLLEHFSNVERPIAEQMRVVKRGGIFFADIVTSRFSVDSVSYLPSYLRKGLSCLTTGRIRELRHVTRKDFYENLLSLSQYVRIVEKYGGKVELALGNRPVTAIGVPLLEGMMLRLYKTKLVQGWWRRFDLSGSCFSRFFGAGWWILATKG